jgi:hypothetical protein
MGTRNKNPRRINPPEKKVEIGNSYSKLFESCKYCVAENAEYMVVLLKSALRKKYSKSIPDFSTLPN